MPVSLRLIKTLQQALKMDREKFKVPRSVQQAIDSKPVKTVEQTVDKLVKAGKLNKDDALPSIRALSADIKVRVITTKKAYEDAEKNRGRAAGGSTGCRTADCLQQQ